ncbi:hypothetical protein AAG570_006673 [Ranatra chinensis]|uniref:SEC7 domain-containing protein n=1 Tax=Ranatra chinensis TaxID=642074 RepID=A0ABD0YUP5_9HEMI
MSLPELICESAPPPPPEYYEQEPPPPLHPPPLEDVTRTNGNPIKEQSQPKFEAFVMTGDRVLKICRNQQALPLNKHSRKLDSLRNHHVNNHNNYQRHNSVPTSPTETERHREKPSSAGTSPIPTAAPVPSSSFVVRTSRSEDHLQFNKDSLSAVSIDIDDDVTSSLNTLLDTRPDSEAEDQRIVWTYNAPLTDSSDSRSPSSVDRSVSPASPTSVSSSVMSSSNSSDSSGDRPHRESDGRSEAVSNISSPDFQEEDSEIIARDLVMEVSDPSDSDSTLLVSETNQPRCNNNSSSSAHNKDAQGEHRIVIQVKGPDKQIDNHNRSNSPRGQPNRHASKSNREAELYNSDAQNAGLVQLTEGAANLAKSISPPSAGSEEDSDVDSLHSFHYSPKAVDMPSAERLAKRLYTLDGFKKSDVSRHLSKNNDFSRAVAEEYLKYFSFSGDTLDAALRKFLSQFSLTGETQERERVLVHFSKRYLESNPGIFSSQDAVHTLTCAIMLLNTDLHGQNLGRKMTCNEFIDNLSELNDGENFPREILKTLYQAIKNHPLEWALDEETEELSTAKVVSERENGSPVITAGKGGLFDVPSSAPAIEYKKGYVMRKCCVEPNGKKSNISFLYLKNTSVPIESK